MKSLEYKHSGRQARKKPCINPGRQQSRSQTPLRANVFNRVEIEILIGGEGGGEGVFI